MYVLLEYIFISELRITSSAKGFRYKRGFIVCHSLCVLVTMKNHYVYTLKLIHYNVLKMTKISRIAIIMVHLKFDMPVCSVTKLET